MAELLQALLPLGLGGLSLKRTVQLTNSPVRAQVADLLERLPAWRERDDFVAPLPVPTVKEYERELPEHAPPPLNPDWDPWDFRSGVADTSFRVKPPEWQEQAGVLRYPAPLLLALL